MKIILGSANLGNQYGILKKKLKSPEFNSALRYLLKKKNNYLETSLEYKSLQNLKKFKDLNKFKITLKINFKDKEYKKKIDDFIKCHKIKKIYCIMLHDPDNLIKKKNNAYKNLNSFKKNKICKYIGVSLYDFSKFDIIFKKYNFDIIQAPVNLFDQRFLDKKKMSFIKKKKIIFQARSIFLQGTLLNKNNFSKTRYYKNYYKFINNSKQSKLFHCLNFIKQINFINFIVIGISSYKDIREIFKNFEMKKRKIDYSILKVNKKEIINPYLWN